MSSKDVVNQSSTPSNVILSPSDNKNILSFINFNNIGANTISNSNAFKKIQSASKSNSSELFVLTSDLTTKYNKINDLYLTDLKLQDVGAYGIKRQHEYTSSLSLLNNTCTNLDNTSVSKLLSYNFSGSSFNNNSVGNLTNNLLNTSVYNNNSVDTNNLKSFSSKVNTNINGTRGITLTSPLTESSSTLNLNTLNNSVYAHDIFFKNFFVKSPNQKILSQDRNIRNIENLNPTKANAHFNSSTSDAINQASTTFVRDHIPTTFLKSSGVSIGLDKFKSDNMNPSILSSNDDLAPSFIFTPF
jgi:hypothetical protein